MRSYSQNAEDVLVADLFGSYKGTLLDIGANDGQTLSNSKLLIDNGWKAVLFEPGAVYLDLCLLHGNNPNVMLYKNGIGDKNEVVKFWDSGAHVPDSKDKGLVSTFDFNETKRWPGVEFTEYEISLITFEQFLKHYLGNTFDFISIDAEGFDWVILQQIDLEVVGCKVLCIEWNGDQELFKKFTDYCKGFRLVDRNNENLIFSKI